MGSTQSQAGARRLLMVSTTPRPLYPKDGPSTHRTVHWGRSNRAQKISPQPALEPRTFQPVVGRYTDFSVPVVNIHVRYYMSVNVKSTSTVLVDQICTELRRTQVVKNLTGVRFTFYGSFTTCLLFREVRRVCYHKPPKSFPTAGI